MGEGSYLPGGSQNDHCSSCTNAGGKMHAAVCEHLAHLNWPDHQICMTAVYKNIKKEYDRSYARLSDKRANGSTAEDKMIPDIMVSKNGKAVWFDISNTMHPFDKFAQKDKKYKDTFDIIPICITPFMQLHKASYLKLIKYVDIERMLRDLVLLKLKTMAVRNKMHQKLIQSNERAATDSQILHIRSAVTNQRFGRTFYSLPGLEPISEEPATPNQSTGHSLFADEPETSGESAEF